MKNSNQTCTFTGHRPERLELPEKQVIQWLDEQIRQAINDGYTEFITGMQRGVDIWAAEAVLKLRNEGKPIRLLPQSHSREWRTDGKEVGRSGTEVLFLSLTRCIISATSRAKKRSLPAIIGW